MQKTPNNLHCASHKLHSKQVAGRRCHQHETSLQWSITL